MLDMDMQARTCVLQVYASEVEKLECDYEEHYIMGLHYLLKGEIDEAYDMLEKVDSIGRQLTYIRSCLESDYKQVVSLH